jgi:Fe-S-cluster containining protein
MADFLGISIDELIQKYYGHKSEDGERLVLEETKRKPCPFLVSGGGKKACGIYPVRPEGCRGFPFDTDRGTDGVPCPAANEVYVSLGAARRSSWKSASIRMTEDLVIDPAWPNSA